MARTDELSKTKTEAGISSLTEGPSTPGYLKRELPTGAAFFIGLYDNTQNQNTERRPKALDCV